MKQVFITLTVALSLFFFQGCKKDRPGDRSDPQPDSEQIADMFNVQDGALMVYEHSLNTHHDSLQAILDMGKWLTHQDGVKTVTLVDDNRLVIQYENGIKSSIGIIREGVNGQHDIRQGGRSTMNGSVTTYHFGGKSNNTLSSKNIGSDKVLILCPFYSEFYSGSYPYLDLFKDAKTPLEVTLITDNKCTIDLLETFHEYGFIILNTHGDVDGSFQLHTGTEKFDLPERPNTTEKQWTAQHIHDFLNISGNDMIQKVKNGYYTFEFTGIINPAGEIKRTVALGVTGLAIKGISNKLKDAVVFGNHCYSGQREEGAEVYVMTARDMPAAWQSAGAAAYYGFAFSDGKTSVVDNKFSLEMEKRIITRLVKEGDSTGIAHLDASLSEYSYPQLRRIRKLVTQVITDSLSVETLKTNWETEKVPDNLYCKLFMSPEYAYGCGEFTDPRDGEKYKLACIGNQVWFAENLRYAGVGRDYDDNPAYRAEYGRLYTFGEAMNSLHSSSNPSGIQGICPKGWHVPSKTEWDELLTAVGTEPETKLRSKDKWSEPGTDDVGFNMKPGGYMSGDVSTLMGSSAFVWSTTQGAIWGDDGGTGYHIIHIRPSSVKYTGWGNPQYGGNHDLGKYSCRCVKD